MWPFQWTPSSSPQSQSHVTAATMVACRSRRHQQVLHLVEHPGPWHGKFEFLWQPAWPCTGILAPPPHTR